MSWVDWLVIAVLVLGALALVMRTRRLLRLSRRQQDEIDYSKVKRFDDDEEDDDWR